VEIRNLKACGEALNKEKKAVALNVEGKSGMFGTETKMFMKSLEKKRKKSVFPSTIELEKRNKQKANHAAKKRMLRCRECR